ncbi:MAG: response regulator [Bacteroidota bacterium]|nr:response regulator [Bacteroidota bacterium]
MKNTPDLKNYNVLVAEDEDANYEYLRLLLTRAGASVYWAKNGEEAITRFKELPEIHLILMDIRMPVINGHMAAKEIRALNAEIPIIAQTAYGTQEDIEKALQHGCNDFLKKPISMNDFYEKIGRILQKN